jgi:hypothetical protein
MGGEPIFQRWFHKTLTIESVFIFHWSNDFDSCNLYQINVFSGVMKQYLIGS